MQNVVSLRKDHPRPQRVILAPRGGARILFFTGVRYCRDEGSDEAAPASALPPHLPPSDRMLDAAAH